MKRVFAFCLICLFLLSGCGIGLGETPGAEGPNAGKPQSGAQAPDAAAAPEATPEATPEPEPLRVLCIMDSLEEDAPEFFAQVKESAKSYNWALTFVEAPGGFESVAGKGGYDGVIALCTQQKTSLNVLEKLAESGVAVTITDMYPEEGSGIPAGVSYAGYRCEELEARVLQEALAYPPHDTPVRLLALLSQKDSLADIAYQQAESEGKIFNRATHYNDGSQTAKAFIEKQLDKWPEGMLDAIYVEEMGTAMLVLDVLKARGREDAEVFAVPNRNMNEQRKLYRRYVFPVAFGADLAAEAAMQSQELARLLEGGQPQQREFEMIVENMEPGN